MNIATIATEHYLPEKRTRRRASTVIGYESSLSLYVLPEFGAMAIEDIDPDHVQRWVDSFDMPGAAEKAYKCLRQVINWAIRKLRLRVFNPTMGDHGGRSWCCYRDGSYGARS